MPEKFMQIAINEAKKSKEDIPVGCVIEHRGQVLASFHNLKEKTNDVTAHAEILAIKEAAKKLKSWRLEDCNLYVTLEPCPMCAWAILNSRIKRVYFGAGDLIYGAFGSKINLAEIQNSKVEIYSGMLEKECRKLLEDYFKKMRK